MVQQSPFEFHLWGRGSHSLHLVHDVSLYKMMVPNLLGVTENNKILPLQNEFSFLSSSYLKGNFHHYKVSFGFNMLLSSST